MEMSWRERLVRSLPYLFVLLGAAGIAVTEEVWLAIVSLVGMWFLPSPLSQPNVSRETSSEVNVSRETSNEWPEYFHTEMMPKHDLPVPCPVLHGSAEAHVLGCEGWRSPE